MSKKTLAVTFAGVIPFLLVLVWILLLKRPTEAPGADGRFFVPSDSSEAESNARQVLSVQGHDLTSSDYSRAVKAGDRRLLQAYSEIGFGPASADSQFMPNIVWAAENDRIDLVKKLLEQSNDRVNTVWAGATPLIAAAAGGHKTVVEYLLDSGAVLDMRPENPFDSEIDCCSNSYTALEAAMLFGANKESASGKRETIDLLLQRGATPCSNKGAIVSAVYEPAILRELLGQNGWRDVLKDEDVAQRALRLAVGGGVYDSVVLLIHAGVDCVPHGAEYAYQLLQRPVATKGSHEDRARLKILTFLVTNGVDCQWRNEATGCSLMEIAEQRRLTNCVDYLKAQSEHSSSFEEHRPKAKPGTEKPSQ